MNKNMPMLNTDEDYPMMVNSYQKENYQDRVMTPIKKSIGPRKTFIM